MSEALKCDQCGVYGKHTEYTWMRLEPGEWRRLGDPECWHFCSSKCLSAWARARTGEATDD